jgi:hypothetical protein
MAAGKDDYCPQCDHCNAHREVTARLGTWNDALNALKNASLPAEEGAPAYTVQDVFMLAAFLDGVTASE